MPRITRYKIDGTWYCPKGHPLIPGNLRGGKRFAAGELQCLRCHREQQRRRKGSTLDSPVAVVGRPLFRTHCIHGHALVEGNLRTGKHSGQCLTCHRLSGRRRYHADPEKHRKTGREYARLHKQEARARLRKWYRDNLEHARLQSRLNGLRRRVGWKHPETAAYVELLVKDRCCFCGDPCEEIDHIEPVIRGGTNEAYNLSAACRRCNRNKSALGLVEFLIRQRLAAA